MLRSHFQRNDFRMAERFSNFSGTTESEQERKKWLYRRGIAFNTQVIVLPTYNDYPIVTTWKMVIKYASDLFFSDDGTIFDRTLNWCFFYFHHDELFFGKDHIYDPGEDERETKAFNEIKSKYPHVKFPY